MTECTDFNALFVHRFIDNQSFRAQFTVHFCARTVHFIFACVTGEH